MTYMQAALTILAHADRPLTVPELTAVAVADGLVHPRGQTPDRTMASVLYRRMAGDPDAPITSRGGRFWLRGRPLPAAEATSSPRRSRRTRTARTTTRHSARRAGPPAPQRASVLPPPPLHVPDGAVPTLPSRRASDYAPTRRDRAVARAGERGARALARLAARRSIAGEWDAARTDTRLIRPLLAHLGYRPALAAVRVEPLGRGGLAYLLRAGATGLAVHVRGLAHDLDKDDAWRALGYAQGAAVPYAAVTNGRELRLYAANIAEAQDDTVAALILVLDLAPAPAATGGGAEQAVAGQAVVPQAAALWLLARESVTSGALDAYVVDCAVGAALLEALDVPDSPLSRLLTAAVRARLGGDLPAELVARHARLVLRGRRGRDGEPVAQDIATVAAVRDVPRVPWTVSVARSA